MNTADAIHILIMLMLLSESGESLSEEVEAQRFQKTKVLGEAAMPCCRE